MKPQTHPNTQEEYFAQVTKLEEKYAELEAKMIKRHEAQALQVPYNEAKPTEEEKAAVLKLDKEQTEEILNLHKEKEGEIAKSGVCTS